MNTVLSQPLSPDAITKKGEEIYMNELKDQLEKTNLGDYVVIEVKTKKHFINKDLVTALEFARKKYPNELFFIVQVGKLQKALMKKRNEQYGWLFWKSANLSQFRN